MADVEGSPKRQRHAPPIRSRAADFLRPYQQRILKVVEKHMLTSQAAVVQMACGTGKTELAIALCARHVSRDPARNRVVFFAPSNLLLQQTYRRFTSMAEKHNLELQISMFRQGSRLPVRWDLGDDLPQVLISSYQMAAQEFPRLRGNVLAFFDEAHHIKPHAHADGGDKNFFDVFNTAEKEKWKRVCLTATPHAKQREGTNGFGTWLKAQDQYGHLLPFTIDRGVEERLAGGSLQRVLLDYRIVLGVTGSLPTELDALIRQFHLPVIQRFRDSRSILVRVAKPSGNARGHGPTPIEVADALMQAVERTGLFSLVRALHSAVGKSLADVKEEFEQATGRKLLIVVHMGTEGIDLVDLDAVINFPGSLSTAGALPCQLLGRLMRPNSASGTPGRFFVHCPNESNMSEPLNVIENLKGYDRRLGGRGFRGSTLPRDFIQAVCFGSATEAERRAAEQRLRDATCTPCADDLPKWVEPTTYEPSGSASGSRGWRPKTEHPFFGLQVVPVPHFVNVVGGGAGAGNGIVPIYLGKAGGDDSDATLEVRLGHCLHGEKGVYPEGEEIKKDMFLDLQSRGFTPFVRWRDDSRPKETETSGLNEFDYAANCQENGVRREPILPNGKITDYPPTREGRRYRMEGSPRLRSEAQSPGCKWFDLEQQPPGTNPRENHPDDERPGAATDSGWTSWKPVVGDVHMAGFKSTLEDDEKAKLERMGVYEWGFRPPG